MWLPGNGPWDSRCERGRDGDAERDKERPIKRGKRPRGARLWVPGRPWGPRCAPCLPTALLTTRRGPQAASGPAAASPHPHRRSPTCRWRPQSAHPALSGSVTWAGQGSGLQPPALPAPPPPPGAPQYLRKPISSQLSPATLALEREEHSRRHVPSVSSNTVSRESPGPTCTAGRQDNRLGHLPARALPAWSPSSGV